MRYEKPRPSAAADAVAGVSCYFGAQTQQFSAAMITDDERLERLLATFVLLIDAMAHKPLIELRSNCAAMLLEAAERELVPELIDGHLALRELNYQWNGAIWQALCPAELAKRIPRCRDMRHRRWSDPPVQKPRL
jgi:hypothetical protein